MSSARVVTSQMLSDALRIAQRLLGEAEAGSLGLGAATSRSQMIGWIADVCEARGLPLVLELAPRNFPDWQRAPRRARKEPGVSAHEWQELIEAEWLRLLNWESVDWANWAARRLRHPKVPESSLFGRTSGASGGRLGPVSIGGVIVD